MNTAIIITATEKLYTLSKRAGVSNDRDACRDAIMARFETMCTDLGKIATQFRAPIWDQVHERVHFLHTEAVQADERRCGTFAHAGSEAALVTSLHALAVVLGFVLADADTAGETINDNTAMSADEQRDAAE